MPRNVIGFILIIVGVALIYSARQRISRANKLREEQEASGIETEHVSSTPPITILIGGFAIVAGFLLLR